LSAASDLPQVQATGARGIIAEFRGEQDVKAAMRFGRPMVGICDSAPTREFPCIVIDEEGVGRMAAQRLLQLGFRRFAFLGADTLWSKRREQSFRATIEAAGFGCPSRFPGDGMGGSARARFFYPDFSLRAWVANLTPPHAVMTCNSGTAARLIEACEDAGLRVPADVAVIGVDDDELTCDYAPVSVTAVDTDWQRIGYEGARVLDLMLRGKTPPNGVVVPPCGIVERHSTDTVPVGSPDVAKALAFIRANVEEPIDVPMVAEKVGVSRRTLERKFKEELKRSPAEEILRTRLARAADLLVAGDESLYEIAERCGFSFRSHLSRSFADCYGQSPSAYGAQHRRLIIR
jgi:LacI family transcriptional regulator